MGLKEENLIVRGPPRFAPRGGGPPGTELGSPRLGRAASFTGPKKRFLIHADTITAPLLAI